MSHARAVRETKRSRVTLLDTRKGELARRLSYLLIQLLFVAICRKIFKLWFLRYKRKVIHRHLCRALAKKVRSLFKIVSYIYSYPSLKPTPLDAARSICLREVSVCCLRSWRDFNMQLGSLRYYDGDGRHEKLNVKKWICVLSISIPITTTHLLCQMQANSFWAEFLRTIFKFRKRKKI